MPDTENMMRNKSRSQLSHCSESGTTKTRLAVPERQREFSQHAYSVYIISASQHTRSGGTQTLGHAV